jgi:hypothetical protein
MGYQVGYQATSAYDSNFRVIKLVLTQQGLTQISLVIKLVLTQQTLVNQTLGNKAGAYAANAYSSNFLIPSW